MMTLRAHFDGRVLVPEEPVDLPRNHTLEIDVREVLEPTPDTDGASLPISRHPVSGFPTFQVPPGTKPLTLEDVLRAEDELE